MTQPTERALSLACVADQSHAAATLHEALLSLFPGAAVQRVDTGVELMVPDAVDCAVVDATVNGADGLDVLRRLRARGYAGAAVLIVDAARSSEVDPEAADRLGARSCSLAESIAPLGSAVADALQVRGGESGETALRALRQTQRLLAAGEVAMRLQHSLNNPLAALLAEAQLLELETTLPADHRESVGRIIELSRRVIDVVRGLDGIGRA